MTAIAARRLQAVSGPAIAAMALVLCAWFASRAMAEWAVPAPEKKVAPAASAVSPPPAPPSRDVVAGVIETGARRPVATPRDGAAFVTRNMFCSSCVLTDGGGGPPPPGGDVPHALPRVIATHVGSSGDGWATLEVSGLAGGFMRGAILPGGGVIETIERGAIVVRFGDDRVRVPLASEAAVVAAKDPAKDPTKAAGDPAKSDPWADRVRVVGENRWEVDRALIRELVQAGTSGNPAAKGVRLMPVNKDGKLAGVRVTTARTGSLATALGLATGDVIESIDGQPIDSPQALMKMYDKLGDLRRVDLGVKRKGTAVTLVYDLP